MKDGAQEILGRTISGVVIKSGSGREPTSQLFLVFSDGSYFEFYSGSGHIHPTGGVSPGGIDEVRRYMDRATEVVFETYPKKLL